MRWLSSLPGAEELCDRTYRQLDKAATSLLLNIAEGNGRYSELDHRRFLDVAAASAVKSAAYLDLCEQKSSPAGMDLSLGSGLLGRITAMLSGFSRAEWCSDKVFDKVFRQSLRQRRCVRPQNVQLQKQPFWLL